MINSTIIGQSIAFLIFVIFCMKYVWPPIMASIEERQKKIEDGLNAAEKAKADLASAETEIEQELNDAKAKAASLIEQASKNANQIIEEAKNQAQEESERIRKQAQLSFEVEVNQAREALRTQVAELAVIGAEKILQEKVNVENHATMLDQLATRL